ncbi:unnamed protein product [Linum trigynum]|uniref:Non-specific lipid-transfer protein n=1 Tax=Linum trigynum TaxID=586398 RepID=A0AAV2FWV9_9ROSI
MMKKRTIISNIVIVFGISAVLFICVAESRHPRPTAVQCSTVEIDAMPCLQFAQGGQDKVPQTCCSGLHNLADSSTTVDDKTASCKCLAAAFQKFPTIKDEDLQKIPGLCNVTVPFPLSKNLKCDNITQFTIGY